MKYGRAILVTVAAFFSAMFVSYAVASVKTIAAEKAIGLGAIAGGLIDSVFSPMFWLLTIVFLGLFFATSHIHRKPLRILFFWVPVVSMWTYGMAVVAFVASLWVYIHRA